MNIIKRSLVLGCAVLASVVIAADAEISLADASAKIGEVIDNPAKMGEVVQQLGKDDQSAYLAKVNAAIGKLPGSVEERAAKFVKVNAEAVKAGRSKKNVPALMTEVFATVPPEALTAVNEFFAAEFLSRTADPTVSDEAFSAMATSLLGKIMERNAGNSDSDIRNAFAVLMFLRADGGKCEGLREALIGKLSAESQEIARNEWIPAAMGEGQSKSYEPMIGSSEMEASEPVAEVVYDLVGPQVPVVLLSYFGNDDAEATKDVARLLTIVEGGNTFEGTEYSAVPRTMNPENPWFGGYRRPVDTEPSNEPHGYFFQYGRGY